LQNKEKGKKTSVYPPHKHPTTKNQKTI